MWNKYFKMFIRFLREEQLYYCLKKTKEKYSELQKVLPEDFTWALSAFPRKYVFKWQKILDISYRKDCIQLFWNFLRKENITDGFLSAFNSRLGQKWRQESSSRNFMDINDFLENGPTTGYINRAFRWDDHLDCGNWSNIDNKWRKFLTENTLRDDRNDRL